MTSARNAAVRSSEAPGSRSGTLPLLEDYDVLLACFDAFPESLLLVENECIRAANSACATLFGYEEACEIAGQPLDKFMVLQQRFCHDTLASRAPHSCEHPSCEQTVQRLNGEEVKVAVRCTHVQHTRHNLLLVALRELKDVELAQLVHDDQLRFRAIFEGAGIGIATSTLDGRILESNPALTRMLGYSAHEFAGMHASQLHPGDFQPDEQLLTELMQGSRESFDLAKRFRRKDASYFCGHVTVSLVRNGEGHPAFLIAMIEDRSAQKRAEEHLREAEKMEVIGRLAGSVAHDFNNILTGILLYSDLLLSGIAPDNQLHSHADEIRAAGEQGAALTQQLLSIARKEQPHPRPVHLNEVLASTQKLLRRLIGEQIELQTFPGADLGTVLADPAQLRQIVLNLALNARDAMPQGGRITISTSATTLPESAARGVSLVVEDTGLGMDTETRTHLFEPFFTTKAAGHGTGLGLATVDRIVKEAGGRIEVESETGRGTKITVILPVTST
jgi:two-component system cell cycle sensor histidine kinase/response regulator CckA